jgi:hypothetical protein
MSRYKASEIPWIEAYMPVRRNKPVPCSTREGMRVTQPFGYAQGRELVEGGEEDFYEGVLLGGV